MSRCTGIALCGIHETGSVAEAALGTTLSRHAARHAVETGRTGVAGSPVTGRGRGGIEGTVETSGT